MYDPNQFPDIGVWNCPSNERQQRRQAPPRTNKGWNPMDSQPQLNYDIPRSIPDQIVFEIWKWGEQEPFTFLIDWNGGDVTCPASAEHLLAIVSKFLKRCQKSEDEAFQEMLSAFVQSEAAVREFIWWLLTNAPFDSIEEVVLGQDLASAAKAYSKSRNDLHQKVDDTLSIFQSCWSGAYDERRVGKILSEIHMDLKTASRNFEVYKGKLLMARLRRIENKACQMLPKSKIRELLSGVCQSVNRNKCNLSRGSNSTELPAPGQSSYTWPTTSAGDILSTSPLLASPARTSQDMTGGLPIQNSNSRLHSESSWRSRDYLSPSLTSSPSSLGSCFSAFEMNGTNREAFNDSGVSGFSGFDHESKLESDMMFDFSEPTSPMNHEVFPSDLACIFENTDPEHHDVILRNIMGAVQLLNFFED